MLPASNAMLEQRKAGSGAVSMRVVAKRSGGVAVGKWSGGGSLLPCRLFAFFLLCLCEGFYF